MLNNTDIFYDPENEQLDKTMETESIDYRDERPEDEFINENAWNMPFNSLEKQNLIQEKLGPCDPSKKHLMIFPGCNFMGKCRN